MDPTRSRAALLFLVILTLTAACAAPGAQTRRTENIVLVTLDGARWQDVFTGLDETILQQTVPKGTDAKTTAVYREFGGATPAERRAKLMPFLWRTLVAQHGFIAGDRSEGGTRATVSVTNRHRFSYPGYSEILTGQPHDDVIKSNDAIRNPFPSVLQFIKRKRQLTPAQVATFASWGVIGSIVESEEGATTVNAGIQAYTPENASPDVRATNDLQFQALTPWSIIRHDAFTFRFAIDYLKRQKPRVLYVSFDETDDWAHDGNYERVLKMLRQSDAYLQELWETLQADPQYRDKTTLVVTTDHGRGPASGGWRNHGSDVPGADEIWFAIASPDVRRRGIWRDGPPLFQNQLASTIAALLGLDYREQNAQAGAAIRLQ